MQCGKAQSGTSAERTCLVLSAISCVSRDFSEIFYQSF